MSGRQLTHRLVGTVQPVTQVAPPTVEVAGVAAAAHVRVATNVLVDLWLMGVSGGESAAWEVRAADGRWIVWAVDAIPVGRVLPGTVTATVVLRRREGAPADVVLPPVRVAALPPGVAWSVSGDTATVVAPD